MTMTATGRRRPVSSDDLTTLRTTLGRLVRILRQHDDQRLGYALVSLLVNIKRNQPVLPGTLAATEHVSPPTIARALNRLMGLGLVTRDQGSDDRRTAHIRLTPVGAARLDEVMRDREAWLAHRLERLTPEERTALLAALPALQRLCDSEPLLGPTPR